MAQYRANAAFVKVPVGSPDGHRAARIITRGAVLPEGVHETKLKELLTLGLIVEVAPATDPDKPLDKRTVEELKAYAAENEIDLGDATKKAEILAVIKAVSDQGDTGNGGDQQDDGAGDGTDA